MVEETVLPYSVACMARTRRSRLNRDSANWMKVGI